MNDFTLIWVHVKSMAEKLMKSDENLLSPELYDQYCSAFEQLMTICDKSPEQVDDIQLADIKYTVQQLEKAYENVQKKIENQIKVERLKSSVSSKYNVNDPLKSYDKTM